MSLPQDIPVVRLTLNADTTREQRLRLLREYLERHQPCIYLPNHDVEHSSVSASLPDLAFTIGILHSDDPQHYDHFLRLGRHWHATVAVSDEIAARAKALAPDLSHTVRSIPYGVDEPRASAGTRSAMESRLELVYAGRIVQGQKRILDLLRIAHGLKERNVPFRLSVAGGGADLERFLAKAAALRASGCLEFVGTLTQTELQELYARSHVAVLPSAFEGLSLFLLESMASGCVPVATTIESGTPQLIRSGENGYLVEPGNIEGFVSCLVDVVRDGECWKRMSLRAADTVRDEFNTGLMLKRYRQLFEEVMKLNR